MVIVQGKKEVTESVVFTPLASDPASEEGKFYYNSTSGRVRFYNGTIWQDLTVAAVAGEQSWLSGKLTNWDVTTNPQTNTELLTSITDNVNMFSYDYVKSRIKVASTNKFYNFNYASQADWTQFTFIGGPGSGSVSAGMGGYGASVNSSTDDFKVARAHWTHNINLKTYGTANIIYVIINRYNTNANAGPSESTNCGLFIADGIADGSGEISLLSNSANPPFNQIFDNVIIELNKTANTARIKYMQRGGNTTGTNGNLALDTFSSTIGLSGAWYLRIRCNSGGDNGTSGGCALGDFAVWEPAGGLEQTKIVKSAGKALGATFSKGGLYVKYFKQDFGSITPITADLLADQRSSNNNGTNFSSTADAWTIFDLVDGNTGKWEFDFKHTDGYPIYIDEIIYVTKN